MFFFLYFGVLLKLIERLISFYIVYKVCSGDVRG